MPSQEYRDLLDRAWDLHVAKNAGYAGADNPDPWANFRMCEAFGISAFDGCMVRMSDKYIRVTNLLKSADNDKVGESLRDTLQDLAAYAYIGICLLDEEQRPKTEDVIRDLNRGWISVKTAMEFIGVDDPARDKETETLPADKSGLSCDHGVLLSERCHVCARDETLVPESPAICAAGTCCAAPGAYPHSGSCHWCSKHANQPVVPTHSPD